MWHSGSVIGAAAFLIGLFIGSFLNVCILRIPKEQSIVHPPSHCPKCKKPIKPYDNIPVLSWLALGGKCRNCKTKISAMYPAVELLTGVLFFLCYRLFGLTLDGGKWAVFCALLIVLIATDIRERILPNIVNLAGFIIGLVISLFALPTDGAAMWLSNRLFDFPPPRPVISLTDALIGAFAGAGLLWIVGEGYFRMRGKEGMGLGDVKMMGMVGTFLGLKRTLLTVLAGSLLGSVIGLIIVLAARKGRDYELPFGAFLGAGALLTIFFGSPLLIWYQSLLVPR
ncbi:MAG TPA: prepilin peptidase [Candidatus Acidoferrales bacterium]|jgi:leader peptidase (prepilin peptidase)/N-methyltransferase|nr:prepilin peptidase [Candidatus Acidoferrales bacterium]